MSRIDLIAFDLDGTLVNSEAVSIPDVVTFLNEAYQVPITTNYWYTNGYHGLAGQALLSKIHADFAIHIDLDEYLPRRQARIPNLFARTGLASAPGVDQVLQWLKAQQRQICVASNSPVSRIKVSFEHAKPAIGSEFGDHIYSALEEGRKPKPAADVYLHVASVFGVNPKDCLAVEDSATGIYSAIAAGFRVIGYPTLAHDPVAEEARLIEAGAHFIMHHWSEFPGLLAQLEDVQENAHGA